MKVEYKIVYIDAKMRTSTGIPDDINENFNKYGREGWELIKIEPKLRGGIMLFGFGWFDQTIGYLAFFKRPLS